MTAVVKHMARNKAGTEGTAIPAQPRNSQLRRQFPPRSVQEWWPATAQGEDEVLRRLTSPPFLPEMKAAQAGRRRGTAKLLRWLSSFPGGTWQQRWEASGSEDHPGSSWAGLPLGWLRDNGLAASSDDNDLSSGLLMLICGDVIRPRMAWMVTRAHRHLAPVMAEVRDSAGFARLRELAESGPASAGRMSGSGPRASRPTPPARAASSPTSPSGTAWRWPTPSGWSTPAAARRRSTSTSACTPWGPSPPTPRPPSARSAWSRDS